MAGHNKWSKVKHIKGAADAKRSKLFSNLSREVTIAARDGGGDPDLNPRLRNAILAAKSKSMPNDTIDRAVKKGTGELGGETIEEALYEGYAPGGVAMLIEVATDNKNRTAADIRSIFNKNNGSLGSSGSVAYMFERKGEIQILADAATEEEVLEAALEAGAEDVESSDEGHTVYTASDQLYAVGEKFQASGLTMESQKLVYIPQTVTQVPDKSTASQVLRLYEALEDCDDTQDVFANFEIPDEILDEISLQ